MSERRPRQDAERNPYQHDADPGDPALSSFTSWHGDGNSWPSPNAMYRGRDEEDNQAWEHHAHTPSPTRPTISSRATSLIDSRASSRVSDVEIDAGVDVEAIDHFLPEEGAALPPRPDHVSDHGDLIDADRQAAEGYSGQADVQLLYSPESSAGSYLLREFVDAPLTSDPFSDARGFQTSHEQLALEVQDIYTVLFIVERRSFDMVRNWAAITLTVGMERQLLHDEPWQTLIRLHRILRYEHDRFCTVEQRLRLGNLSTPEARPLRCAARQWLRGIRSFLDFLLRHPPASREDMMMFVSQCYSGMRLWEHVEATSHNMWIEYPDDLDEDSMAREDYMRETQRRGFGWHDSASPGSGCRHVRHDPRSITAA